MFRTFSNDLKVFSIFFLSIFTEKKLIDPVIDPREPWKKMINRIVEFEEPPMVERSELPSKL
jgi:hypothetical protein